MPASLPSFLAIAGPTASGKTALALALAEHVKCEIISVDSALVYRHMDIGTAKPTEHERQLVAHHLIDIRDPNQSYSAADFVRDTQGLLSAIHQRGALPVLVGGTMMYFRALLDGLDELPPANPAIRAQIDAQAQEVGWPEMHARLAAVDPAAARRLAPYDSQRIQRALEVFQVSGIPLSHHHSGKRQAVTGPKSCTLVSLEPTERSWLHARIQERFQVMLQAGLVQEVEQLRLRGDLHPNLPSMRCVGYRQTWEALDGLWPMDELLERGAAATRQLAKRQITWLRSMPQRHVLPCDQPQATAQALQWLLRHLPSTT